MAAPSGEANSPSARASRFMPSRISPSETATAAPPLSRSTLKIRRSAKGFGTRRPPAIVRAPSQGSASARPSRKAFTRGAQPSACTAIILGRFSLTKPSLPSSSNAFQKPTSPVPPPVGYTTASGSSH